MAKFYLSKRAVVDLSDIWHYTCETWSENQADKYYNSLIVCCQELAYRPESGRKYDQVLSSLLGHKLKQHIIFYRQIATEEIEIVRILHSRMDLKRRLL